MQRPPDTATLHVMRNMTSLLEGRCKDEPLEVRRSPESKLVLCRLLSRAGGQR